MVYPHFDLKKSQKNSGDSILTLVVVISGILRKLTEGFCFFYTGSANSYVTKNTYYISRQKNHTHTHRKCPSNLQFPLSEPRGQAWNISNSKGFVIKL